MNNSTIFVDNSNIIMNNFSSIMLDNSSTVWPPLDMRGVTQPVPSTKDITVIIFIAMLWAYSIYLTAR